MQVGLPNNQWTIEIANWFAVSMARLQLQTVEFATGPLYTYDGMHFVPGSKKACSRQKIRSAAGYTSFSIIAVSLILSIGGALIFTSLVLDTIVGYFRKTFKRNVHKLLQWDGDELLKLQGDRSSEGDAISETTTLDKHRSPIVSE